MSTVRVVVDLPDGPPPPPFVREQRRRRRTVAAAIAAVVVVAVPVGLALAGGLDRGADEPAAAGDGAPTGDAPDEGDAPAGDLDADAEAAPRADDDAAEDGAPDDGPAPAPDDGVPGGPGSGAPDRSVQLDPPELAGLAGVDLVYADLLIGIDASEWAMISFQDALGAAIREFSFAPETLLAELRAVAAESRTDLLAVRERLAVRVADDGAERVRELYVIHLDAWADYMAAVEEDPTVLGFGGETGHTVAINQTADAFARALEEELPAGIDPEVERYAEAILDRGFRGFGQAQV